MLQKEMMELADTKWVSPIVFAPKTDSSLGFCIGYRKLNAGTVKDLYALTRMHERIDFIGEAQIFLKLDANSGYWRIEIDECDRSKTAFTSHHGLFSFVRIPFTLNNAPLTFQRVMDVILFSVK